MAVAQAQNGGGAAGGAGGGSYEAVEFVPIAGISSIRIGGANLPGTVSVKQTGGINAPTKSTEKGYDYTTRVNREARQASITGWIDGDGLAALKRLRYKQEPFTTVAGSIIIANSTLDNLTESQSGDTKGGAVKITADVREVKMAETGTTSVIANASTGKKSGGLFGGVFSDDSGVVGGGGGDSLNPDGGEQSSVPGGDLTWGW